MKTYEPAYYRDAHAQSNGYEAYPFPSQFQSPKAGRSLLILFGGYGRTYRGLE